MFGDMVADPPTEMASSGVVRRPLRQGSEAGIIWSIAWGRVTWSPTSDCVGVICRLGGAVMYEDPPTFEESRQRFEELRRVEWHQEVWMGLQRGVDEVLSKQGSPDGVQSVWEFAWDGRSTGGWVWGWPIDSRFFLTWNGCLLARYSLDGWLTFPSLPRAGFDRYSLIAAGTEKDLWVSTVTPAMIAEAWGLREHRPAAAGDEAKDAIQRRLQSLQGRNAKRLPAPHAGESSQEGRTKVWGPLKPGVDFRTNREPRGASWFALLAGAFLGVLLWAWLGLEQGIGSDLGGPLSLDVLLAAVLLGIGAALLGVEVARSSTGRRPRLEKGTKIFRRLRSYACASCQTPWGANPRYCQKRGHSSTGAHKVEVIRIAKSSTPAGAGFLRTGPITGPQLMRVEMSPYREFGAPILDHPPQ